MAKWPNSSSTGVPAGVTLLPSGGINITQPGVTVSGLHITGPVYILADNVTLQNCKISSDEFSTVYISKGLTGVVVKNCDIDGQNSGSNGIFGQGTFLDNDIYNIENGIAVAGDNTLIQGNYIHDFGGLSTSHYDGVEIDGGNSNVVVRGNTIINDQGQTSAVMIDNYFGPISNILVEDNLLAGGGFTVYCDGHFNDYPIDNVRIINNHIGKGYYGDLYINETQPEYKGNAMNGWPLIDQLDKQPDDGGNAEPPPPPPPPPPPVSPPPPPPQHSHGGPTAASDLLTGSDANNVIKALGGHDKVNGAGGHDTLYGDGGNDSLMGGDGNDRLIGGAGKDILRGGSGKDSFAFGAAGDSGTAAASRDVITDFTKGYDKIDLASMDANTGVSGVQHFTLLSGNGASFTSKAGQLIWQTDAANNRTVIQGDVNGDRRSDFSIELTGAKSLSTKDFVGVSGQAAPSTPPPVVKPPVPTATITGTSGTDILRGDDRHNTIYGRDGNDRMSGGGGNDTLIGGNGRDVMSGSSGHDVFKFGSAREIGTTPQTRDAVADFTHGQDKIDLSFIDANSRVAGNQAFSFLPGDDQWFQHRAGQLAWRTEGNHTLIQGDTNGDGVHDFELELSGRHHLTAADFIL